MIRKFILATALLIATTSLAGADENINPKAMHIYKTPWCGCCQVWTDAMKKAGYKVTIENVEDLSVIKKLAGVPDKLESCHTAQLGDYTLEGHVPLEAIQRLMTERPKIKGLAVPGMPQGSLGMGYDPSAKYENYSFTNDRSNEPQVFYKAGA